MNKLDHIQRYYFIGIGGIGMSALAQYFYNAGFEVAGYDKTTSLITEKLEQLGIAITYDASASAIPDAFKDVKTTLIVYTPAVPNSHAGLSYFKENGFSLKKRAEVLGMLTQEKFCLAVAGTHGKTTTSSMLGHILAETGASVTAFLGGIAENYQSNLIQKGEEVIVVEADEFDRSFMQLYPNIACITSVDADHLDIYGDEESLTQSFKDFSSQVKEQGQLIVHNNLPIKGITVGVEDNAQYSAQNIRIVHGAYHFDLHFPDGVLEDLLINLPGRHNLSNAVTALAMAIEFGSPTTGLAKALMTFKGVSRRFTYRIKRQDRILIDDYAHHPTEINAVHNAVREMYPEDKVLVVFQPHLYSRTRDFMEDFARSLGQFDELLLLDIYPAREEPIAGIDADHLLAMIESDTLSRKQKINKESLLDAVKNSETRIQVFLGAGDIGEEVLKITKALAL